MINIIFKSPGQLRYEGKQLVSSALEGASRVIKVEPNINGYGVLVSIFNAEGKHPYWGDNLQMAPKQMKIIEQTNNKIILKGFGFDVMGASFEDYGLTINFENNEIADCILHLHDRCIDIKYLSKIYGSEFNSKVEESLKNGIIKEENSNGDIIEKNYINNKAQGEWKLYFRNGNIKEIGFAVDDKNHGPWKAYYIDGVLRAEGQYENNFQHGLFKFYDERGTLRAEGSYNCSQQIEKWIYYNMFGIIEGTEIF